MIRVGSARMQNMRIAQELNITDIQHHVQRETDASLLEDAESLFLSLGKSGDDSRVAEAGQGADVVGVPLCVDAAVVAALEVDDAGADVLFFALGGFSLAVEVPDWLGEGLEDVWPFRG
jgi:hypothetical protein